MSILEVLMIVCFGVAWPINLYNSFKSKSTKGKNLLFRVDFNAVFVEQLFCSCFTEMGTTKASTTFATQTTDSAVV